MLTITRESGDVITLVGRLDAAQVHTADEALGAIEGSVKADLSGLDYISSAGLGVLLKLHKRLDDAGHALVLAGMNRRVRTVFVYAGLDKIFTIED